MSKQLLAGLVLSIFAVGCGGGPADLPDLAPVSGVVLQGGNPVPNPVVTFYPESGPAGIGRGNEQGEFTIMTNGEKGAPIGKCKVTVTSSGSGTPEMDGSEGEIKEDTTVNPKYASATTTDLSVDVTAEGNTD